MPAKDQAAEIREEEGKEEEAGEVGELGAASRAQRLRHRPGRDRPFFRSCEGMVERYRHHYLSSDHELVLFDGTSELIEALHGRGHLLAVATGKSRKGLDRALGFSGLGRFFHATRCADECFSKPHPQMLDELLDELGVAAESCLMIGDTTHDLQMARNAGVAALAVSFGAHPVEQLEAEAPLACLHTPAALRDWLERHA